MRAVGFACGALACVWLSGGWARVGCDSISPNDGSGSEPCNRNVEGRLEIDVIDAMVAGSPSIDGGCSDLHCSLPVDGGCTEWTAVVAPDGKSCTITFTSSSGNTTSTTIVTTQGCDGLAAPELVGVGQHGIDKEI